METHVAAGAFSASVRRGAIEKFRPVIPRLARAPGVGDRLRYRCLRFVREYPILTPGSELGWAHYRVVIEVQDKAQRKALESAARKNRWKAEELERRVRMLNAVNVLPTLLSPSLSP